MPKLLLAPFELLYAAAVRRRNAHFDTAKTAVLRAPGPVISVGNVSTGGTGKTPFVHTLARYLLESGKRPAIVSRGYRRRSKGQLIVCDGRQILCSPAAAGDECYLHARALTIPVIADADRHAGARTAFERFACDVVILDDGFQHRRLYRDCDIVLIDRESLNDGHLLPRGRLREPLDGVQRAHVLCAVGDVSPAEIASLAARGQVCIKAQTDVQGIEPVLLTDEAPGVPGPGSAVLAFCGIARAERFRASLQHRGLDVRYFVEFADHYLYRESDIAALARLCKKYQVRTLVCTEKDAVKLSAFAAYLRDCSLDVYALVIRMRIASGEAAFIRAIGKVFEQRREK